MAKPTMIKPTLTINKTTASTLAVLALFALLTAAIARLPTSNAGFVDTTDSSLVTNAAEMLQWETGSTFDDYLIWWFDGSETSTLFADAGCTTPAAAQGTIGCWKDRRPGRSQATGGTGPVLNSTGINGRSTVHFDQLDGLIGPNLYPAGTTDSTTIFIVFRENVRMHNFLLSLNGNNTSTTRFNMSLPWGTGIHYFDPGNWSADRVHSGSTDTAVGATTLITAWKHPNTMLNYMEVNGTRYNSTGFSAGQVSGGLRLGSTGGYKSDHDIAELLIFDRVMGDVERTKITTYLQNKWATP